MEENINTILYALQEDFINNSGDFLLSAKIIAGIGALIMGFITYRKIMMDGDVNGAINAFVIKCVLVGFGILFYGTLIRFINAPLNLMTQNIKEITLAQDESTHELFTQKMNDPAEARISNTEHDERIAKLLNEDSDTPPSEDETSQGILSSIVNIGDSMDAFFARAFYNILMSLASFCLIIINVVRTFFLIVLSLFGIFVIALSMYPGLEGSFGQWLQKYINIYLWLPISYILGGIIAKLFEYMALESNADQGTQLGGFGAILAICAIISYAAIPTMSSWLVNASTSGMASKVKGNVSAAAQAVKKIATKGAA